MNAPTGRKPSVSAIESAMSLSGRWKSSAIAVSEKTTKKKSNATRVQPEKPASKAARCPSVCNDVSVDDEFVLVCNIGYQVQGDH